MVSILRLMAVSSVVLCCAMAVPSGQTPARDAAAWLNIARQQATAIQQQLSAFAAEEEYIQVVRVNREYVSETHRTAHSNLLFVRGSVAPYWLAFRDVFDVDGRAVRDRRERLVEMLRGPDGPRAAGAITRQSAKFNLGDVSRPMHAPMLGLAYLTDSRLRVWDKGEVLEDGVPQVRVGFNEVAKPSLLRSSRGEDVTASGTVWLRSDTASIERIQLRWHLDAPDPRPRGPRAGFRPIDVTVTTVYAHDARLGSTVPVIMQEAYFTRRELIVCLSRYTNPRTVALEMKDLAK